MDTFKARKAIPVPLNAEAVVIIRRQIGKHATYVFSYQGQRVGQLNTKACYAALKRAGIEDFRWHDMRHTWATWHVQQGTPLHALQELGGWESPEMVRRYAHFSAEHLAPYADRLCALLAVDDVPHGTTHCKWQRACMHVDQDGRTRFVDRLRNGNYHWQINPVNGVRSMCALSGKGIRYWDWIPKTFGLEADAPVKPCPFKGGVFQWMRNLVAAQAWAHEEGCEPFFVVVCAQDLPNSPDPIAL